MRLSVSVCVYANILSLWVISASVCVRYMLCTSFSFDFVLYFWCCLLKKMDSKAVSKHLFIRLYSLNFSFRRTIFFSWNSIFSLNLNPIHALFCFSNELLFGTNEREKKKFGFSFDGKKMNDSKNGQTHFSSRFSVFADSFVRLSHSRSTFHTRYIVFWLQNSWTFDTETEKKGKFNIFIENIKNQTSSVCWKRMHVYHFSFCNNRFVQSTRADALTSVASENFHSIDSPRKSSKISR